MLTDAVKAALESQPADGRDKATAALAVRYATLIDEAAPAGRYTEALDWLHRTAGKSDDRDADKHARTILRALAHHSVASELGPKLLSALEALQLSPRARHAAAGRNADDKPGPLDQLAARRVGKGRTEDRHTTAS